MKTYTTSQMIFVEGKDGADFAAKYNAAMQGLKDRDIKVDEKQISIEKLSAYILYTETTKIAEGLQDKLLLEGIVPVCRECPHYEPITTYEGECPHCNTKRALLKADMKICKIRWRELEAVYGQGGDDEE